MSHIAVVWSLASGLGILAASAALAAQATERVLYVTALEEKTWAPVVSLTPADIRVTEDDRAREVLRVSPATSPMPIAVVVDNQARAQATIADLRSALAGALPEFAALGPVALVSTADRPTILQDYTTDTKQLADGVARVFAQPDSGATLLDAIVDVSRGLARREEDRAAIVLVTTELTEFSTLHFSQVLDRLKQGGAMMSAVVLQNPAGSMLDDAGRNRAVVLDRGVRETGGTRVDVLTSISYGQALKQVAAALRSQYRVVYARPRQLIPPQRISVAAARSGLFIVGAPARGQKER